jgi:glycerophosphoryl diester phosphodiesterase
MTRPLFLGHRGTRIYAPENTFAAFDLCLEHGCDGFEFDVRRTKDGVAAVNHDAHFHKLKMDESTFAKLKALAPLPTLEETVRVYGQRCYINIELKETGLEQETLRVLELAPPQRGVMVSSFVPEVIEALAQMRNAGGVPAGKVPLGYICRNLKLLSKWKKLPISHAIINHAIYSKQLQSELKDAGIKLFIWTVNEPDEIRKFIQLGVDGLVSDDSKMSVLVKTP